MSWLKELLASRLLVLETLCIVVLFSHAFLLPVPLVTQESALLDGSPPSASATRQTIIQTAGPLPSLILSGMAKIGFNSSFSLRLVCLAGHALNCMLLAVLTAHLFGISLPGGALCGIIFGLFPGNTFLLFFPFSLGQLMATALVLTALLDYSESGNPWRLWLWTALGLLCHPLALFAPLLCLAIALLRPLNSMQKSAGTGAAAFFLLAGAITAADTWLSDPGQQAISLKNFAEFSARAIMPLQPFTTLPSQKLYILAPLIAAAAGYLGLRWLGRKQTLFLALAWACTALTPLLPLAIFGDGNLRNLIPEHNAYLLALAPSLALGMLLHAFWRRHRNLRWAPATAVLLAYAFTISQIPGQSKKLFREIWYWKAVTASYQSQPGFLNSRARALFQEGDSYEAIQTYKQALHTRKSGAAEAAESMSGLGEIALRLSMPNSAVIYFTAALKADPGNNRAKGLLARAYLPVKKRKTAEQLMKTAETPELLYQRGMLRLNLEEYNGAFSDFREACARDKAFCTAL